MQKIDFYRAVFLYGKFEIILLAAEIPRGSRQCISVVKLIHGNFIRGPKRIVVLRLPVVGRRILTAKLYLDLRSACLCVHDIISSGLCTDSAALGRPVIRNRPALCQRGKLLADHHIAAAFFCVRGHADGKISLLFYFDLKIGGVCACRGIAIRTVQRNGPRRRRPCPSYFGNSRKLLILRTLRIFDILRYLQSFRIFGVPDVLGVFRILRVFRHFRGICIFCIFDIFGILRILSGFGIPGVLRVFRHFRGIRILCIFDIFYIFCILCRFGSFRVLRCFGIFYILRVLSGFGIPGVLRRFGSFRILRRLNALFCRSRSVPLSGIHRSSCGQHFTDPDR